MWHISKYSIYYFLYVVVSEANKIKSEVESGPNKHLYQQYMVEREYVQEESEMPLTQQWSQFFNMKYLMLQRR